MADARSEEAASGVIGSVRFSFYTAEEIRRLSVKRITKSDLLDEKQAPVPDGLYDPALGPLKDTDPCKSCGQLSVRCPGHFGHIDLAKQVYHPLLFSNLKQLLHTICFHCHRFKRKEEKVQIYVCQLELIMRGDVVASRNLKDLSLDEPFSPEEHSLKSAASFSSGSYTKSKDLKKQTLTSFQYTEAKQVLSDFMHYKAKKCENCNKKSPRITSPVFGWLNKVTMISDIRSNTLLETKLGASLGDGDSPDTGIISEAGNPEVLQSDFENALETDEVSTVIKASKQTKKPPRGLPREFINQMNSSGKKHLLPSEVERILESVWKNEPQLCTMICDIQCRSLNTSVRPKGYAMFFLKALLVPPSKFRPPAKIDRGVLEHPQNVLLSNLQDSDILLRNLIETDPGIVRRWMDLQKNVNILFDSSKGLGKTEKETSGLRQLLEKKTGILRQKMMGKRVNFACRSVISPDPYLAVNEIGIPPYFALRLTYPERVTPWNVHRLKHAMENGADRHPGATHYKDRERMYKLQSGQMRNANSRKLHTSRGVMPQTGKDPESEFEGKVVYRHVRDGDIVLVNRQPTLHKPSLMAHVVRVLKGEKTLRMHYANCSTYNADFDGDEMNVHLPQDEVSRAEAVNIVNANMQYTVPTSGDPIRGLIQDHIISSVLLTKKDTFLNQDEYHQLLYASCVPSTDLPYQPGKSDRKIYTLYSDNEIQPLFPAILKPKPFWTGKQVISAILCYITRGHQPFSVEHKGKIPSEYFTKDCSEQKMYVYNNELVHGMIDKNQFGKYGLVHTVHELYGPDKAGTLLSVFSRLFTSYLQMHGSTCGVDDLLLAHDSELERKRILEKSEVLSEDVHLRFTASEMGDIDPMELHTEVEKVIRSNGDIATTRLDRMMSNALNGLTSEVNMTLFPNGLQKPFPRNCLSLMTASGAKGGPVNMSQISSLLGQQELEGKRVPRMMSGKTLPSFPPWDISSRAGGFISDRFLTGLRPQEYYFHCMAGRDGLVDTAIKTSRSGYLQRCLIKNLEALKVNYDHTVRDADGSVIQFTYGEDGVDVLKSSFITEFEVLAANHKVILERLSSQLEDARLSKSNGYIEKLPLILRDKETSFLREKEKDGVTTNLLKKQRSSVHQIKTKDVKKLMKFKYLSSLAEPGEPVGVIAAQSIGEPSTQMTLNTFHFAGRGERNVTLGIPRLQEILMNAKQNIQTPVMTCPLLDGRTREDAEHIAAKFRRISVADIVESMEVCTVPFCIYKDRVGTIYKLKMKLYPLDLYPPHSDVTLETRTEALEKVFVAAMEDAIAKHMEILSKINDIGDVSRMQESSFLEGGEEDTPKTKADDDGGGGGGNDDNDESIEDQGADAEKRKRQINDEMEYEEVDRKRFDVTEEFDGAPPSEIESDVDEGEVEDFTMGEESLDNEDEVDAPETESKAKPTSVSEPSKKKSKSETKKKASMPKRNKRKVERVINYKSKGSKFEVNFIFRKEPHILLAEIAQKTAKRVYVKEYKNIEQCSVVERKRDKKSIELQTSGVNFAAFWNLDDFLNVNELETNDVHAMLETYGVEAARATIIKEVKNVFELYGIQVDIRHLSLIADFMTTHGGYRPMNRIGMGNFSTSPFTKMTFETATKFIFEAATRGEVDNLESPSASVCLGQPMKMGTGCFDLMQNLAI